MIKKLKKKLIKKRKILNQNRIFNLYINIYIIFSIYEDYK